MILAFIGFFLSVLVGLECTPTTRTTSYEPKMIDKIDVKLPGFVSFIPSTNGRNYHLAITSFDGAPFSSDHVFYVPNYTGTTPAKEIIELSNNNVVWPNEATYTNRSIVSDEIDKYGGLLVPGGFLVPSKNNGGLYYYPFESADRSKVSQQPPIEFSSRTQTSTSWFYHRYLI